MNVTAGGPGRVQGAGGGEAAAAGGAPGHPRGGPRPLLPQLVPLPVRGHAPRQHLPPHLGRIPLRGLQGNTPIIHQCISHHQSTAPTHAIHYLF